MKAWLVVPAIVLITGSQLPAAPAGQETEHLVQKGETLNGIANRSGVPRSAIIEANDLEPPYIIRIGQKLTIPRDDQPASRSIPARSPDAPSIGPPPDTHVVEAGETLSGIALSEQVPRVLIAEANALKPPFVIKVGQKLRIPRTRHYTVQKGDTGFSLAYRFAVPWHDIATANGMDPDTPLRAGQELLIPTILDDPGKAAAPVTVTPPPPPTSATAPSGPRFIWPVTGPIRRGYRPRGSVGFHDGLDIEAPEGTPVEATAAGRVIYADREKSQFGNLVVIDHGNGWYSAYGSLSRITVKKGEQVDQGERIGLVGDTSVTRRNELHFELRQGGKPVDPIAELPDAQ